MSCAFIRCRKCGQVLAIPMYEDTTSAKLEATAQVASDLHHPPRTRIFMHPDAIPYAARIQAETGRTAFVTDAANVELLVLPTPTPCPNPQDFHEPSRMDAICRMTGAELDRPLPTGDGDG